MSQGQSLAFYSKAARQWADGRLRQAAAGGQQTPDAKLSPAAFERRRGSHGWRRRRQIKLLFDLDSSLFVLLVFVYIVFVS